MNNPKLKESDFRCVAEPIPGIEIYAAVQEESIEEDEE